MAFLSMYECCLRYRTYDTPVIVITTMGMS